MTSSSSAAFSLPLYPLILLLALLTRALTSFFPHSGEGVPPMHGDYEAQRHWMELTLELPAMQWYTYDLPYWGLDYPPLSAYQSWACGWALRGMGEGDAVAFESSRGYESVSSKRAMRTTVMVSEALTLVPAAVAVAGTVGRGEGGGSALMLAALMLQPALVLIDHGHFQYNCISLGLALFAVWAIHGGRRGLGSVLFTLAMVHKHMAAYYAPAFFANLLGRCLQERTLRAKALAVAKLGLIVIGTLAMVWAPWLHSPPAAMQVLRRLIPIQRGLFEDYVSNFWCATNLVVKWKRLFSSEQLALVCIPLTAAAFLPSMVQQIRNPSTRGLLLGMFSSSLAFYLFSFQVHEKGVLLPMLPAAALVGCHPEFFAGFGFFAAASMLPLLIKDGLTFAYFGNMLVYAAVVVLSEPQKRGGRLPPYGRVVRIGSMVIALPLVALHIAKILIEPPASLPYLWDALLSMVCFVYFMGVFLMANALQWSMWPVVVNTKAKAS